ncbi:fimbria/pilus outer membrane usher protein [Shigella flexneri]
MNGSYSRSSTYRQAGASVSGGIVAWSGGVDLANRLSETFAVMNAPGIKDAYVNGQKYRTTNRNGVVIYDGIDTVSGRLLMLDVSQSNSEAELRGNRKLPPLIAARLYWLILIPISASPGLLKR